MLLIPSIRNENAPSKASKRSPSAARVFQQLIFLSIAVGRAIRWQGSGGHQALNCVGASLWGRRRHAWIKSHASSASPWLQSSMVGIGARHPLRQRILPRQVDAGVLAGQPQLAEGALACPLAAGGNCCRAAGVGGAGVGGMSRGSWGELL